MKKNNIQEYAEKMISGDINAQNEIINYYINFIQKTVQTRFNSKNYNQQELIEAGKIGLFNALKIYKKCKKTNFSSFTYIYINREIEKKKKEQSDKIIQKYATILDSDNLDIQNKIIDYYTNFINKKIKKMYMNNNYNKDNLLKAGLNGLYNAIKYYESNKEFYFPTIAENYINKEIYIEKRKQIPTIEICSEKMITDDTRARDKIIGYYINHVKQMIETKYSNNYNKDDLLEAGLFGILKAINYYKTKNINAKFSSYIHKHINVEINKVLKKEKENLSISYIGLNNNYREYTYTDSLDYVEDVVLIKTHIERLPQKNKEIIYLHLYKNIPFKDIAKIYNISRQAIEQNYQKSLEIIKEEINTENNNLIKAKKKAKTRKK